MSQSPIRQQIAVMGPERPGPKFDCNANYRPILSSEWASYFGIKILSHQEKKQENLVRDRKKSLASRETGQLTARRNLISTSQQPVTTVGRAQGTFLYSRTTWQHPRG
jgi:hypothetical protein